MIYAKLGRNFEEINMRGVKDFLFFLVGRIRKTRRKKDFYRDTLLICRVDFLVERKGGDRNSRNREREIISRGRRDLLS